MGICDTDPWPARIETHRGVRPIMGHGQGVGIMAYIPYSQFEALLKKQKEKKEKRKDNAKFIRKASGKPRFPSIKTLAKKLWDITTLIVRRRDGPICKACKKNQGYAINHIVPQNEGNALRYELDNLFWGCRECNYSENNYRGRWQRIKFPEIFGKEFVEDLWAKAGQIVQFRRPDYECMIAERQAMLENGKKNGRCVMTTSACSRK